MIKKDELGKRLLVFQEMHNRLTKKQMTEGDTPFIGSIDSNNGQRQYVSASPNHTGNSITVNYNGSVAEAFYQPVPFWASDDVNVLYPKFDLNNISGCFSALSFDKKNSGTTMDENGILKG